eukprot:TRINITY_DN33052_c1_g2_i1.p1 TRINITY_DN33052_c1_g2~~TRINITY_DN33052_c1_g2_i1.p1  ORF type:complete len:288 (-),score=45.69 TRINITY_DN33052_c1_g2_i1:42-785(-)
MAPQTSTVSLSGITDGDEDRRSDEVIARMEDMFAEHLLQVEARIFKVQEDGRRHRALIDRQQSDLCMIRHRLLRLERSANSTHSLATPEQVPISLPAAVAGKGSSENLGMCEYLVQEDQTSTLVESTLADVKAELAVLGMAFSELNDKIAAYDASTKKHVENCLDNITESPLPESFLHVRADLNLGPRAVRAATLAALHDSCEPCVDRFSISTETATSAFKSDNKEAGLHGASDENDSRGSLSQFRW